MLAATGGEDERVPLPPLELRTPEGIATPAAPNSAFEPPLGAMSWSEVPQPDSPEMRRGFQESRSLARRASAPLGESLIPLCVEEMVTPTVAFMRKQCVGATDTRSHRLRRPSRQRRRRSLLAFRITFALLTLCAAAASIGICIWLVITEVRAAVALVLA